MPQYVAFLRGINLGNRRLKMTQLKGLFEEMGFTEVTTFIASGNVCFESKLRSDEKLSEQIQKHLAEALGYEVDTFVRTRAEVEAVVANVPFAKAEIENPNHTIHVGFLWKPLLPEQTKQLSACRTEVDEFRVQGREYYWLCRIKTNESKVWALKELKAIKLPSATMRNLKMLRRLVEWEGAGSE